MQPLKGETDLNAPVNENVKASSDLSSIRSNHTCAEAERLLAISASPTPEAVTRRRSVNLLGARSARRQETCALPLPPDDASLFKVKLVCLLTQAKERFYLKICFCGNRMRRHFR